MSQGTNSTIFPCVLAVLLFVGRGLLFPSGEDEHSVLDGLTITQGKVEHGGGTCCTNPSNPTTVDSRMFRGNLADEADLGHVDTSYHYPSVRIALLLFTSSDQKGLRR